MRDYSLVEEYLISFLQKNVNKTGFKNTLLGVSGGIDSAVVAFLAKKAFGKNFSVAMIPTNSSNPKSMQDAKLLCDVLDLDYKIIEIGNIVDEYSKIIDLKDRLRLGNFAARIRMATLYDYSAEKNAIVLGTSNKSELMLGYGTIYGDLAYAINPVADLYKTEIFEFASFLGIPQVIIDKPPSADLWVGQRDEDELGYTYAQIDPVLHDIAENNFSKEDLEKKYNKNLVEMVFQRRNKNAFKHKKPIMASFENLNEFDFLFPRTKSQKGII